jgi:hypothetical protein
MDGKRENCCRRRQRLFSRLLFREVECWVGCMVTIPFVGILLSCRQSKLESTEVGLFERNVFWPAALVADENGVKNAYLLKMKVSGLKHYVE